MSLQHVLGRYLSLGLQCFSDGREGRHRRAGKTSQGQMTTQLDQKEETSMSDGLYKVIEVLSNSNRPHITKRHERAPVHISQTAGARASRPHVLAAVQVICGCETSA